MLGRTTNEIEQRTPIVPRAIAEGVWEEAVHLVGEPLPKSWIRRLCSRANTVYANNCRFRKLIDSPGDLGRDWLWAFTRHWMAALIYRHRRELYWRLPEYFSRGHGSK